MAAGHDLIVIGAGSAGLPAAGFAARAGARTALVEGDRIGGDCTWTGCVPSKALLHAARVAHQMRHGDRWGLPAAPPAVDLGAVMAGVRAAVDRVYATETPEALAAAGVDVVLGAARFLDPHTIEVNGERMTARRFLVCTGAVPDRPAIPGLAETLHRTHLDVFELDELPESLVVLGAGPVGCEMAQAFARLGARVTLVGRAATLLPAGHSDARGLLAEVFLEEGIELRLGARVTSVAPDPVRPGAVTLVVDGQEIAASALLVATGRRARCADLNLAAAGVELDAGAIRVDSRLRTSRPHIYAAGDVTGSFQFTHLASWQGFTAARNALFPGASNGVLASVPWVVFTDPEVGQVGELAGEPHEWPLARMDRAQAVAARRGLLRVYTRPDGGINGALVCLEAGGELINELAVAITAGLKLHELATTIHVYPTFGFAIQQLAAEAAVGRATSGLRGRLLRGLAR